MNERRPGVGHAVMLVLTTVLFAAAWRSDQPGRERFAAPLTRTSVPERTTSLVALSAVSMGAALPSCAAARPALPEQTNGLTWHSDQGFGDALGRSFSAPADKQTGLTGGAAFGGHLGAQLAAAHCARPIAGQESAPIPALLSGTSDNSGASPSHAVNSADDVANADTAPALR